MKSEPPGTNTSAVDVTHVSLHGIWLLCDKQEYHLPFEKFPWFKQATIQQIHDVKRLSKTHLRWESLDVDLSLSMIKNPEEYPLVAKS